jgi:hypothetical protein
VPSLLPQPKLNSGFTLAGVAASRTIASGMLPPVVHAVMIHWVAAPRLALGSAWVMPTQRSTFGGSATAWAPVRDDVAGVPVFGSPGPAGALVLATGVGSAGWVDLVDAGITVAVGDGFAVRDGVAVGDAFAEWDGVADAFGDADLDALVAGDGDGDTEGSAVGEALALALLLAVGFGVVVALGVTVVVVFADAVLVTFGVAVDDSDLVADVLGLDVFGSDVFGSDVVGSDVFGSDVVGSAVGVGVGVTEGVALLLALVVALVVVAAPPVVVALANTDEWLGEAVVDFVAAGVVDFVSDGVADGVAVADLLGVGVGVGVLLGVAVLLGVGVGVGVGVGGGGAGRFSGSQEAPFPAVTATVSWLEKAVSAVVPPSTAASDTPEAAVARTPPVTRVTATGRARVKRMKRPTSPARYCCGTTHSVWSGFMGPHTPPSCDTSSIRH